MPSNLLNLPRIHPSSIAFVLVPRFNMMTLTTLIEVLRIANYLSSENLYHWRFISFEDSEVKASNGLSINAGSLNDCSEDFEMVFVVGSWGCEHFDSPELSNWLRLLNLKGVTICGVELAVYLLAQARLLSKKQVTTHWSYIAGFAELFPNTDVVEQLYTVDKNILTCSGGTAGIDMMLYLIGKKHGEHLKSEIAEQMMHYPIRNADRAQRSTLGAPSQSIHPVILSVIKLLEENVTEPVKMPDIAKQVDMSQRQLERYFKRYLGCSLVQFSLLLRLQYARVLLTGTNMSVRETSVASGFNSMSHFAHAFMKCFGKTPSQYRRAWPDSESTPSWPGTVFSFIELSRMKFIKKAQNRNTATD